MLMAGDKSGQPSSSKAPENTRRSSSHGNLDHRLWHVRGAVWETVGSAAGPEFCTAGALLEAWWMQGANVG
jgi:hypothetical protein